MQHQNQKIVVKRSAWQTFLRKPHEIHEIASCAWLRVVMCVLQKCKRDFQSKLNFNNGKLNHLGAIKLIIRFIWWIANMLRTVRHIVLEFSFSSLCATCYRGFYLIPIITLHPDQLIVSKLLIIHESCISLESVTFWEESNCIKYVSSNLCSWSMINQDHYRMTTYHYVMILIYHGSGTQIWRNLFNAIRFFPKSYTFKANTTFVNDQ